MPIKLFSAVVAVVLLLAFLLPLIIKLKLVALGVVVLIGIAMMAVDLLQSLRSQED